MARRLPPLNALKAFEAAARHGSFTLAADELHVTQGAVSRQVQALEDHYRTALFRRGHRRITLTDAGRMLVPVVGEALDRIAAISDRLVAEDRDLKVKVTPTFAIRLLIPRLSRFQSTHPNVHVRLTTAWEHVDFDREDFDAAIVYDDARRGRPGLRSDLIFVERMMPVCAPSLLEGPIPLRTPEDLRHHPLILNIAHATDWHRWAEAVGLAPLRFDDAMVFDVDVNAILAATASHGIAIAAVQMVADDLASGRLVAPFDLPPVEVGFYSFVSPERQADSPRVVAFRDWLMAELGERSGRKKKKRKKKDRDKTTKDTRSSAMDPLP